MRKVREMSGKMHAHACVCENSMPYFQKNLPAAGGRLAGLRTNLDVGEKEVREKGLWVREKVREKSGKMVLEFWQTPCIWNMNKNHMLWLI